MYELWSLDDVYALLGLEVDAYDTAPCSLAVQRALRQPLRQVLGWRDLAHWNDHGCPGPAAAEQLLRAAPRRRPDRATVPDRERRAPRDWTLGDNRARWGATDATRGCQAGH